MWFVNNHTDSSGMPYKNRVYTVFSGGDDLCILGSWDAVMQFLDSNYLAGNCADDSIVKNGTDKGNYSGPLRITIPV